MKVKKVSKFETVFKIIYCLKLNAKILIKANKLKSVIVLMHFLKISNLQTIQFFLNTCNKFLQYLYGICTFLGIL